MLGNKNEDIGTFLLRFVCSIVYSVFTHSSRDGKPFAESPVHVVSPEQFSAAEQRHEQERIIAKHVKEKEPAKDTEALRVSVEQLREVMFYV